MDSVDIVSYLHGTERRRRVWLGVLIVAGGTQAIVTQSLLLREALVLMFGSEFAWGIVLFAWLLGVALGAVVGGWVAERIERHDAALVSALMALSLAACVELWVFRGARSWLGVEPGELLPLATTVLAAMLFVSPVSALVGMAFPLACCVRVSNEPRALSRAESPRGLKPAARGSLQLGRVFALESAGSLIGGAAFSFWAVERLSPIQTALCCAGVMAAASAGFLNATGRRRSCAAGLAALAVGILATSLVAGDALDRKLIQRRWMNIAPGYELCAEVESKYQNLSLGRRAEQFTLYSDGQVAADFPDPYTFVPLAHFWLCQHPAPRRVLVLGGGAEGLIAEILRHPVEHIDYVEPDPRVVELIEQYLPESDRQALNDPRVTVHNVDVRYFVKTRHSQFDLVISRPGEPTSALRARLYTDEFYGELARAMTPRSVLCLTAFATPGGLSAASGEYLASIRAALQRHFPHVTVGWGNPAHVLAAKQPGLVSTDPAELARRYVERGIESRWFRPGWFDGATDWLSPDKLRQRADELDAVTTPQISTDLRPAVYMQRLALWESATTSHGVSHREGRSTAARRTGYVLQWLRSVTWPQLICALLAIAGVTLLACWVTRRRAAGLSPGEETVPAGAHASQTKDVLLQRYTWISNGAIVLSIGTTGFATMALSIIWLFAFQNLYGYVYQRIGWIIALFMGGLVIGCELVNRRPRGGAPGGGHPCGGSGEQGVGEGLSTGSIQSVEPSGLSASLWGRLILVDALLALLALSVPFILPALGAMQGSPLALTLVEWCVSLMVALTGVLGGAAFALAGRLQLQATGLPGSAAGTIVGADHAGACLGALLSGILLVPVFGTAAAAFFLAGIKLSSVALLLVGGRHVFTRCRRG